MAASVPCAAVSAIFADRSRFLEKAVDELEPVFICSISGLRHPARALWQGAGKLANSTDSNRRRFRELRASTQR